MSQLQTLLDERYPILNIWGDEYLQQKENRRIFTEGYNAAMQEIYPLIKVAHKSAMNKAVYKPLEEAMGISLAVLGETNK